MKVHVADCIDAYADLRIVQTGTFGVKFTCPTACVRMLKLNLGSFFLFYLPTLIMFWHALNSFYYITFQILLLGPPMVVPMEEELFIYTTVQWGE